MSDEVLLEYDGAVAHLILNRPDRLNALSMSALRRIQNLLAEIAANRQARCVVVRATGRAFCAGVDLDDTADVMQTPHSVTDLSELVHQTFSAIERLPLPTIAAIQGFAIAGGLELAMVCDFVVMASDARLGDHHARYGLFPGGGSSQRLPRLIGERRAKWLLMSGEWIDAATAESYGLANRVVAAEALLEQAQVMASLLADRSPLLNREIKETLRDGRALELDDALAQERPRVLRYMRSADARIGLQAFMDRERPVFVGE